MGVSEAGPIQIADGRRLSLASLPPLESWLRRLSFGIRLFT
jgi:hypothetical protein